MLFLVQTFCDVHINKDDVSISKFNVVQNTDVHINNICVTDCSELNIGFHASKQHIQEIENLVTNYHSIKTKSTHIELDIQLLKHTPIFDKPRCLPFIERDIIAQQVQIWLADGIIESSSSDYSSQVVVVKKKIIVRELAYIFINSTKKLSKRGILFL